MQENSNFDKTIPSVSLFGLEEEAFYQLGLKDRDTAKYSMKMINELISTQWDSVNFVLHKGISNFINQLYLKDRHFEVLLNAYAQGAQIESKDLLSSLLIPEICSFVGPWTKMISPINFGCSSIFTLNEKQNPVHVRILDFPLKNTYDTNERIVYTHLKNQLQTMTFSSSGLPFAGLTSMNEAGLSVCLHQKFTKNFNQHGLPIFYIAHRIITTCKNTKEASKLLETFESITCWNINIMDKEGLVLEIDLDGKDRTSNLYNLHEIKFKYICNQVLDHKLETDIITPLGMKNYNDIRIKNSKKIEKKIFEKSNHEILKQIASPVSKDLTSLSAITPSSMVCCLFDPNDEIATYICGEAPKIYTSKICEINNLWSHNNKKEVVRNSKKVSNLRAKNLYNHLILAQHYFDTSDANLCYHHLQMSLELCEKEEVSVVKFFFIAAQYIYEPHQVALAHLQDELAEIFSELNDYFKDMATILDQRISILLSGAPALKHDIQNLELRQRFETEKKANKIIHNSLRKFTFLHLDILDIIFI